MLVLAVLAVMALADPLFLVLYGACGAVVLAGVYVRRCGVAQCPWRFRVRVAPGFLGFRPYLRPRRAKVLASGGGEKRLNLNVNKKLLAGFAVVSVVALLAGVVIGTILVQYRFSGSGRIVIPPELGVYSDSACTVHVASLDFGTFAPGENVSRSFFVRNEGSEVGVLSLASQNWSPTVAKEYLVLSWNLEGQEIAGAAVKEAVLNIRALSTLTNESGVSSFSFDAVLILEIGGA